jgi:hypothetical protein
MAQKGKKRFKLRMSFLQLLEITSVKLQFTVYGYFFFFLVIGNLRVQKCLTVMFCKWAPELLWLRFDLLSCQWREKKRRL